MLLNIFADLYVLDSSAVELRSVISILQLFNSQYLVSAITRNQTILLLLQPEIMEVAKVTAGTMKYVNIICI